MLTQAVAEAHAAVPEGVAVVLGSGMSGLSTAKVLSKHFSTVKVLERDNIRSEWTGETAVDASKVRLLFWSHTHALPWSAAQMPYATAAAQSRHALVPFSTCRMSSLHHTYSCLTPPWRCLCRRARGDGVVLDR